VVKIETKNIILFLLIGLVVGGLVGYFIWGSSTKDEVVGLTWGKCEEECYNSASEAADRYKEGGGTDYAGSFGSEFRFCWRMFCSSREYK